MVIHAKSESGVSEEKYSQHRNEILFQYENLPQESHYNKWHTGKKSNVLNAAK